MESITYRGADRDIAGIFNSISYADVIENTVKEVTGNVFTDYSYDASGNRVITYEGNNSDSIFMLTVTLYDKED